MLGIRTLRVWIKGIGHWLRLAPRFWIVPLVALGLPIIGLLLPGPNEDHLRYSGLVLQLLGIATVLDGLRHRRRIFDRPTPATSLFRWLARFPRWPGRPQTFSLTGTGGLSISGGGEPQCWRAVPTEGSVEPRFAALEANLDTLRAQQAKTTRQLQEETAKRVEGLDSERQLRESADRELAVNLDTLGAGRLHVETAGVVWLILGVVLATVPSEIAGLVDWFH